MDSSEISEFGLVIIESLGEEDKKTGKLLYDNVIKYKKFQEENLLAFFYQVPNRKKFIETIDKIIEKVQEDKFFPILHIEAHGSENGIVLASNELITWEELFEKTREINILLKNHLTIHLGLCKGISIISKTNPSERAPFKAVIGTPQDIGENDLLMAYEEFYDHYFFSFSPQVSVDKMNEVINESEASFYVLISDEVYDKILDPDRDPDNLNRIVSEIALSEKATNQKYKNTDLSVIKKEVEEIVRTIIKEEKENRDYFTMKDLQKE
jgi:hypothetical protein